jgi:hypothetical protein
MGIPAASSAARTGRRRKCLHGRMSRAVLFGSPLRHALPQPTAAAIRARWSPTINAFDHLSARYESTLEAQVLTEHGNSLERRGSTERARHSTHLSDVRCRSFPQPRVKQGYLREPEVFNVACDQRKAVFDGYCGNHGVDGRRLHAA